MSKITRLHLRSAHQILSTLFPGQPEFLKGLDDVLQRLEFGLGPADKIDIDRPAATRFQDQWPSLSVRKRAP